MLLPGLVSVTFRKLSPAEIIALVVKTGLCGIEWGGDIHVPNGDVARAREVRAMTADGGLEVAAYGSYYRVAESAAEGLIFERVLETAQALGAPLIRVWAGRERSAVADPAYRERVGSDSHRITELASQAGMVVAYEFHDGTLTDTAESARALLEAVGHPNLKTLWQPRHVGLSDDEATVTANLADLETLLPWLTNLHAFHETVNETGHEAQPLAAGQVDWERYLKLAASIVGDRYVLLEFVRDESAEAFANDARALREWLRRDL